jgi:hypothetical protein
MKLQINYSIAIYVYFYGVLLNEIADFYTLGGLGRNEFNENLATFLWKKIIYIFFSFAFLILCAD